jgi:hypothetical protein
VVERLSAVPLCVGARGLPALPRIPRAVESELLRAAGEHDGGLGLQDEKAGERTVGSFN